MSHEPAPSSVPDTRMGVTAGADNGDGDRSEDGDTLVRAPAKRKRNGYLEWLIVIVVAMTSALVVRAFVVQQFAVDGTSMLSTLHNGDRVLVNKLSYHLHDPRRGDVVVLKTIEGVAERDLIKRVVGLPGETISYQSCVLRVNGKVVNEPYLDPTIVTSTSCGPPFSDTIVQKDHVFVMGDNRGGSKDSRDEQVGQITYGNLVGRAFVIIWPFGDWKWL
ncbi:MAG: signal peptidase [Ilumatobacteraceae bacterium]|jgi:signal peptidase I|nr:signal peptidase [Ilumatobacteraceae bacterium]